MDVKIGANLFFNAVRNRRQMSVHETLSQTMIDKGYR